MVSQSRYQEAFASALSANNLNLVLWLCSSVDSAQLFKAKPPTVSQAVTLSVIQQMSYDLASSSAQIPLKLAWLHAAVEVLDPADPNIQAHVPRIVNALHDKLAVLIREQQGDTSSKARALMHLVKFVQTNLVQ